MNVLHTEMQGYYSKCNLIQEKGEIGGGGQKGINLVRRRNIESFYQTNTLVRLIKSRWGSRTAVSSPAGPR